MYIQLADRKRIGGKLTLVAVKDIKQTEIENFFNQQKPISDYNHIKYIYKILLSNANQLQAFLNSIFLNDSFTEKMDEEEIYLEGNRLIANYCSTIGMYIDQIEKVLSRLDKKKLKGFRETCSQLYNEKFEYRFFVLLRNYIMHYSLPFTVYYKSIQEGYGLVFDKKELLGFKKWKHVRKDLESMDELIDIRPYIKPMNVNSTILFYDFIYFMSKEIVKAYEEFGGFVVKNRVKFPAIIRYKSIEEFKKGNISMTPIDYKDVQLAFNDVKRHPKINLQITDITPDWFSN